MSRGWPPTPCQWRPAPDISKHEESNRAGEIAMIALGVDHAEELIECQALQSGDAATLIPERLLKGYGRFVPVDDNGAGDDR